MLTLKDARSRSKVVLKRLVHRNQIRANYYFGRGGEFQPLFVVSQPRTGSTLLQDYLDSVPGVSMTGEVLSVSLPIGLRTRFVSKRDALRHIRYSLHALPGEVRGAKFLIDQMRLHEIELDDLRGEFPGARYLILYRRSLLEQFVSFRVAKLTGKWVGKSGQSRFNGRLHVDPDELLVHCRREREKYQSVLRHSWIGECSRVISYEELTEDPQSAFESVIFPLLGCEACSIATKMEKQITRSMADVIANYDDIEERLPEFELDLSGECGWGAVGDTAARDRAAGAAR